LKVENPVRRRALQSLFGAIVPDDYEDAEDDGDDEDPVEDDEDQADEDDDGMDGAPEVAGVTDVESRLTTKIRKRHPASGLMSDDESDSDIPHTSRTYIKNPATWRDPQITVALREVDYHLPQSRPERTPGNVARVRVPSGDEHRMPSLPKANRKGMVQGAPIGLPINYYDNTWRNSLAPRDKTKLRHKPAHNWDPSSAFR
jgi:hypothetical protein